MVIPIAASAYCFGTFPSCFQDLWPKWPREVNDDGLQYGNPSVLGLTEIYSDETNAPRPFD